ncbi:MAG: DNA topoisomerase 4 subunit A [Christensenellaceae bacterium]|nr:DNA topoisomerase 4 subunit A [Christensenellaceae bacterium]
MAKKIVPSEITHKNQIIIQSMDDVMHSSMLPYAEHVILERALPRVEDGLKPVQRRILYTMLELGLSPDKPHRKSARIVGDCLGKFHPHGDSSVYDAMVRMAQDFNMRIPLVDGHGNFGSMDGDSAAAMRYTEARMTPAAMQLLRDLDKDTVKFVLNFDDTLKEPELLPGRFPNLLINGSNGIAVGLTTSIPPHNPVEAIDAVIAKLRKPDISLDELMKIIPCPDFPTGGYLINSDEIRSSYETGRGKLINRAKTHFEQLKNGKTNIVITEFPYQVNKAAALEKILSLVQQKKTLFSGISDIRDESDRTGIRAVIEVKKDFDANKVLNALFKYSDLQKTVSVIMVAIADGKPKTLSLSELLDHYIRHQEQVVTRRCKCELEQAERRAHVLQGLIIALLNLDEVIALIRASKTPKIAKQGLMERFDLTAIQADAILDLRLQRLTNLEQLEIEKEFNNLTKEIKRLNAILASKDKLDKLIIDELTELRDLLDSPRRTMLIDGEAAIEVDTDEEFAAEPACVLLLNDNKLRRLQPKAVTEELLKQEQPIFVFNTSTDRFIRLFTTHGACITLSVNDLPETKPTAKPTNLSSIIEMEKDEGILAAFDSDFGSGKLFFYTKNGLIKCTEAAEYVTKTKRITAVNLKEDDALLSVEYVSDGSSADSIILITSKGMSIRFASDSVPVTGRVSSGVKGIKLDDGDIVVYAGHLSDEGELLTATDRGYMKRSFVFDHDLQGRNGKGLQCFGFKKNGSNGTKIVAVVHIKEPEDLIAIKKSGERTAFNSEEVRIESRTGKGQPIVMVLMDDTVCRIIRAK